MILLLFNLGIQMIRFGGLEGQCSQRNQSQNS